MATGRRNTNTAAQTNKPQFQIFDPTEAISQKLDFYIKIVIVILIVGFVTMIAMVGTLVIDSFHFNSATYTEYSNKTQTFNDTQKTNQVLLKQINSQQKTILEQQKLIESLKGKTQ